ncbi:MAG: hydroxyacid dehydrogenase [Flavobacteriales bacterium]|nr:hydroxyacid dehydrogenase [Flavobacteriales bacterium]
MKILFFDKTNVELKQKLEKIGLECVDEKEKDQKNIIGIIARNQIINAKIIKQYPKLKFIARCGSGIENIEKEYCEEKKIKIINSPEGNAQAVAEYCMGAVFNLTRNIKTSNQEITNNIWEREKNRTHELTNYTVGIIGYGNTGKAFAKILNKFKMKVIAYDKYKKNISDKYVEEVDLETIFIKTDILSIHINYSIENEFFINQNFLNSFKKNIFLINTSRGKCLKTNALINMIKNKRISGAALDVIEYEDENFKKINFKSKSDFDFIKKSNKIIITPHIAGITYESKNKIQQVLLNKISKII